MKSIESDKGFKTNLEYVSAMLEYATLLARKRLCQRRLEERAAGAQAIVQGSRRGRVSYEEQAPRRELLAEQRRLIRKVRERKGVLDARIARTLEEGQVSLPLENLAKEHGLVEFEKFVLLMALGPSLDTTFLQIMQEASAGRSTEVGAFLETLCETMEERISARRYFIHSGTLLAKGLINLAYSNDMQTESQFIHMDIEVPRRISSMILGEYDVDDQLITFSSIIDPEVEIDQVVLPRGKKEEVMHLLSRRDEYLAARREWGFDRILSYGKGIVMLFSGPSGAGKTMLAHALAKSTGHRLMLVDIRKVISLRRGDFEENLQRVFHEARLQHAILFFDEADEMFSDRAWNGAMPTLLREFERLDEVAILATNRKQVLDEALERRILYKLDFEMPTPQMREAIWRNHLPAEAPLAEDIDLTALAEEFEFTGGFIKNAVLVAMHHALQRTGAERKITQEDLRAGAQLQRQNRLEATADKVVPKVGLKDVVLAPETRRQVESFINAARKRALVYSQWGFGRKLTTGKALSALFMGESGVGKTMTAEAIAFELGQNLFPVRFSSLISKYVGDTEKNIVAVFRAAKEAQSVLFFDEADAIFAGRLDEGDHHARYINQQVDTLLMEMEKYEGLVILASNRPEAFDQAFERRIRHRIRFEKPDAAAREAIWRTIVPSEAPLGADVDFAALAKEFTFTGGIIKNVVLRAAFEAATDGRVLTQEILRRCAREETPLVERRSIGFHRVS